MSKLSSVLCLLCLIPSTVVFAAPTRQGPYLGAYVGSAFGSNDVSTNVGGISSLSYFSNTADIHAVTDAGTWNDTPIMAIGGIQVGHDWVWHKMVYGLLVDFGSLTLNSEENKAANYPSGAGAFSLNTTMKTDWLLTLRGKIGFETTWSWPSFLYVTGGMAMTNVQLENQFSDDSSLNGMGGASITQNQIGWTAGLGVEVASFKFVSVGLEYLFVQVPSTEVTSTITNAQGGFGIPPQSLTSPFTSTGKFEANLLKVVVNYRFQE